MKKTFVLGVGAQKCGTTWLRYILDESPGTNMGFMKEYHIWDAMYVDINREARPTIWKAFLSVTSKVMSKRARKASLRPRDRNALMRYKMINQEGFYERYFSGLLDDGSTITGDITPAYSMLSADRFRQIRHRLVSAGFEVKVVFLMRDPVSRCWSASRMKIRKGRDMPEGLPPGLLEDPAALDIELLRRRYALPEFEERTRYDLTVKNLESAFRPEELHFALFEELFTVGEISRLGTFLGIEFDEELAGVSKNVSPQTSVMDRNLENEIIAYYGDTYQFCHERFPATRKLWKHR